MVRAIVGANWGDEGKGKITDMLAEDSDIVIRFQGGANAGHTIINSFGKFALHQLPSGIFSPNTVNIIANGVALDINKLMTEIADIVRINSSVPAPNLVVSERTQIVTPYHILFDTLEEKRLSDKQFGSTKSGIAPFYADKYAKIGIQICELFDEAALREKIAGILVVKNVLLKHLYNATELTVDEIFNELIRQRDLVAPYIMDTTSFLIKAVKEGKRILLEGQLGSLKDPDFGIYPFTTSSHTLAGFGAIGAGIAPHQIKEVICVAKAYSSAVGAGAFVSEIFGEEANTMRELGGDAGEYGATTGRPRRMGYFDCVATKYGCDVQGATQVALTAIDVLGYMDEINVCVAYDIDGVITTDFPVTPKLNRAKPVYKVLKGWKRYLRGETDYEKLPIEAKEYVSFIQEQIGYPIKFISTGPNRSEIIRL